jgi:tetratricopeptide (TPR) repeat protein
MDTNKKYIYIFLGALLLNIIIMNVLMEKDKGRLLQEQNELASGIVFLNQGLNEEAIKLFELHKDKRYSRDFVYNIYLARMYSKEGHFDKAKDHYQISYNINPAVLNEESFIKEISEVEGKNNE